MALSPPLYCNHCGAANQAYAVQCFACQETLAAPVKEVLLKERYRILAPLGQGGFGAVYKAVDTEAGNCLVALKKVNLSVLTAQDAIEAIDGFNREVLMLSGLVHPHLPRIHEHFIDGESSYLVLDFIEGETLEQYLEKTKIGHLSREEVMRIGMQLCSVLDYLHTREPAIIFRDLKPSNVMRTSSGHLYLIDFGIARHYKPGRARDTMVLGSPGYAAPEQYGRAQTTPQADIYSLGALLTYLLTGNDPSQLPFAALQTHAEANPDRLQSLLARMLALDMERRPTSVTAVMQELEEMLRSLRPSRKLRTIYREHRGLVLSLAWSPDGTSLVSGASDGSMHVWNAATGDTLFTHRDQHKSYAWTWSLAWSPDGTCIASGTDDKTVDVWRVANAETSIPIRHSHPYRGHSDWVNAVRWSPDGTRIASGSNDKTVQLWRVQKDAMPERVDVYEGHTRWVLAVEWSPDGTTIASGSNDATVQLWDVATKRTLLTYRGHNFGVNTLAWSPDGTRVASCSGDNEIRVWEVATGNTLLTYRGHRFGVNTLAWSPDGSRIASAGRGKTVYIWNVTTGRTVYTYRGHSGWVYSLAWSPDGEYIASAGSDKTVQVWKAVEVSEWEKSRTIY